MSLVVARRSDDEIGLMAGSADTFDEGFGISCRKRYLRSARWLRLRYDRKAQQDKRSSRERSTVFFRHCIPRGSGRRPIDGYPSSRHLMNSIREIGRNPYRRVCSGAESPQDLALPS